MERSASPYGCGSVWVNLPRARQQETLKTGAARFMKDGVNPTDESGALGCMVAMLILSADLYAQLPFGRNATSQITDNSLPGCPVRHAENCRPPKRIFINLLSYSKNLAYSGYAPERYFKL